MTESKFIITCQKCGGTNCTFHAEYDYDWNEESYLTGQFILCEDCHEYEDWG